MISYQINNNYNIIPAWKIPIIPYLQNNGGYPYFTGIQYRVSGTNPPLSTQSITNYFRPASLDPYINTIEWIRRIMIPAFNSWYHEIQRKYGINDILQKNAYLNFYGWQYLYFKIYNWLKNKIEELNTTTYPISDPPYLKYSYNRLSVTMNMTYNLSLESSFNEVEIIYNNLRGSKSINIQPNQVQWKAVRSNNIYMYGSITFELSGDKYSSETMTFELKREEPNES